MPNPDLLLSLNVAGEATESRLLDRRSGACLASGTGPLPPSEAEATTENRVLTASALPSVVRAELRSHLERGSVRLGLQLGLGVSEDLPWECLHTDLGIKGPLCLDTRVHLYRHSDSNVPVLPTVGGLLRVLIVVANPGTAEYPFLPHAEREACSVEEALRYPENRRISVRRISHTTPRDLVAALREFRPDVLHFIGHGDWMPSGGKLVLESGSLDAEASEGIYADALAKELLEAGTSLVFLSGCFTAGLARSVGAELASYGLAAVVGMRFAVADASAHLFARSFYAGLGEGLPVETAVSEGRAALRGTHDWAAPLLHLSREFSFPGKPPRPRHNIPADDRPFVGRVQERTLLAKKLIEGEARLVTVTGMGGMGKTRLAKQVSVDVAAHFSDGVWLVECEALSEETELLAALGAALSLDGVPVRQATIEEHLADRHTLLVFDCFERIVSQKDVLVKILRACPKVRILVTSRVLLSVAAESPYELCPMSHRRRKGAPAEATDLFVRSARFVRDDFTVTTKNRRLVESLIHDLEAVPLALVLAAGRLRHMELAVLAERVRDQRLEILKRRPLGPNDRHADVRRVVADSLELLFDVDRELLRALAVFQGGFFEEDVHQVLGSVEDGLWLLRDHSLLMTHEMSGATRFRILDTVRECLEELPVDETVTARHAALFAAKADDVRRLFDRGEYAAARSKLWTDIGNFGRAVAWCIEGQDQKQLRHFARCLARVYFEAGARREFEILVQATEGIADDDPRLMIELTGLRGELYKRENQPSLAEAQWRRRAKLCEDLGDTEAQADSLLDIAANALEHEKYPVVEEALDSVGRMNLPPGPVRASGAAIRAKLRLRQERAEEAVALCESVETEMAAVTSDRNTLFLWISLAQVYRGAGQPEQSVRLSHRLLREALEYGHHLSVGKALLELTEAHLASDQVQPAAEALAVATRMPEGVSGDLRKRIQKLAQHTLAGQTGAEFKEALERAATADWLTLATVLPNPFASPTP